MVADFEVRTSSELKRLAKKLRQLDEKELKKRLTKELRAAGKPLVPRVRSAARATPSKRPYRPDGLRGTLSKAVKLQVRTSGRDAGVTLRVDGRKMPAHMKALPKYMEGKKKPWRHRVYGRDVWVTQEPHPFFYKSLQASGPLARAAVNRVVDGIKRDLER
ncbi:hypothetical protein [Streptomyces sp. NPDC002676]